MPIDWGRPGREKKAREKLVMFFWNVASACRCSLVHKLNKENDIVSDAEMMWGDPLILGHDPGYVKGDGVWSCYLCAVENKAHKFYVHNKQSYCPECYLNVFEKEPAPP